MNRWFSQAIVSIVMIFIGDIYSLINYMMFAESFFLLATIGGMLQLRRKKSDLLRPIKVNFIISNWIDI